MSKDLTWLKKIGENAVTRVPTGESVQLQSLWKENTVVLYFLRRFGCPICQYLAKQLSKIKPALDENDVKLVGIGPEELGSKEFHEAGYLQGELYFDPEKKSYKDLQFRRYNMFNVLGGALSSKSRELANLASKEGIKGNFSGDLMQTGGLLIVKQGGDDVLFNFKQKDAADHVENQKILDILGIKQKVEQAEEDSMPSCSIDPGSS